METELLNLLLRTTHHVNDYLSFQNSSESKPSQTALLELIQILFEQFKYVVNAHTTFLDHMNRAVRTHKLDVKVYDIKDVWMKVQSVVSLQTRHMYDYIVFILFKSCGIYWHS